MPAQSAEGIILRKYYLRETSYILVVFTKEFGKIRGVLKGVRNPYPQFAGNFEIFTKCHLLFYRKKKRQLDLITQCEATDYFLNTRKDIERLTYANYFIELIDIVTVDHDVSEELYNILDGSLKLLSSGSSPKRTGRIFELKLLSALGLSPRIDECAECSAPIDKGAVFSISSGGVLCASCKHKDTSSMRVSFGTIKFMQKILATEIDKTEHVKVSKEVGEETERILCRFLQYHINRPVKSLKFLGDMQKAGVV